MFIVNQVYRYIMSSDVHNMVPSNVAWYIYHNAVAYNTCQLGQLATSCEPSTADIAMAIVKDCIQPLTNIVTQGVPCCIIFKTHNK